MILGHGIHSVQKRERLWVARGVTAEFDPEVASILKRGAMLALVFGFIGGAVLGNYYGWFGFLAGWAVFGVLGKLIGLIWGVMSQ